MRLSVAALGLILTACYSGSEGISPPLNRVYFPTGLTTDCDSRAGAPENCEAKRLYVVSSDFDLQYNAGSVQALDLDRVREVVSRLYGESDDSEFSRDGSIDCARAGLAGQNAGERVLVPGPCRAVDLERPADGGTPIVVDSVGIGAFATDVVLSTYRDPEDPDSLRKRLIVPVRGEASLHWIDLTGDGKLDCGQDAESSTCAREHRVGTEASENTRNIRMPSEPYAVATSHEGDAIVVTHQTEGLLSLFHQDVRDKYGWERGPNLESTYWLPSVQAVAVAAVPESQFVRAQRWKWLAEDRQRGVDPYPPSFLVTYANAAQVELVRFYADEPASPSRPFIQGAATIPIRANSGDRVSRGIAFDDTKRRECDAAYCAAGIETPECRECAGKSVGVYVSSRSPASLLVGATAPSAPESYGRDTPQFVDALALPVGPSRVYAGKVVGEDGRLQTRLFVVCFDQRRIAIFDPKTNRIEAYVTTGRGPHAMAFDFHEDESEDRSASRALAYVGHFTDSYLGVIQLDRRQLRTYGSIILSLSQRLAPRASK